MKKLFAKPGLLLSFLALLLYISTISFDFTYDDALLIENNSAVTHQGSSLGSLVDIFKIPTYPGDLYRPIPILTYRLSYLAFGLSPSIFHLTNIALYAFLIFLIFEFLSSTTNSAVAIWATLLFVIHPLHVEVVASIVGRAEMLALIGGLGSFLILKNLDLSWSLVRQSTWFLLALLLALTAIFSKESALTFTALVPLALLVGAGAGSRRKPLFATAVWLLAASIYLLLRAKVLGSQFSIESSPQGGEFPENPLLNLGFMERIVPVLSLYGRYAVQTLLPFWLSADYSMNRTDFMLRVFSLVGFFELLVAGFGFLLLWVRRRQSGSLFLLWYFLSFALTINLLVPIGTVLADRLAFTPSLGLLAYLSHILVRPSKSRLAQWFALTVLSAIFFAVTLSRVPLWRDNITLSRSMIADNPESPKAYYNLAHYTAQTSKNLPEIEALCKESIRLDPKYFAAHYCLGDIARASGHPDKARFWFKRALEIEPSNPDVLKELENLSKSDGS